jgi:hypothetical protein
VSEIILHLKTQHGQPYGSERRCCERCGIMIWGNVPIKDGGRWTDEEDTFLNPPQGFRRCDAPEGRQGDGQT